MRPHRYHLRATVCLTKASIRVLLWAMTIVDAVRLWRRYPRGY
jgi:hypothetical protein